MPTLRCGLIRAEGVGKTGITLAIVMLLRQRKLIKGALIVGPLDVIYNVWPRECAKWDQFKDFKISILHGKDKAKALETEADLYLINFEGLEWLVKTLNEKKAWQKDILPFDLLAIDEASKTKNPSSKRFKLFKSIVGFFRRVIELTGMPAPNGLQDVWAQIYLLDGGAALGRYKTHFWDSYFHQVGYGGYTLVLKQGADEQIYDAISHLVHRMDARDYLDLPELLVNDILVTLPVEHRENYKKLDDVAMLTLESGVKIKPINTAAAVNKCLQFTNGFVFDDNGEDWHFIHDAKIDALKNLVDELQGKPLLCGYWYKPDAKRLKEAFKAPDVAFIEGGMDAKDVAPILDRWDKGELRILFAQMQKAAWGLNLQSGPGANVAYFGLQYDLDCYEQFFRRIYRQGQQQKVTIHRLLCDKTIDVAVAKVLEKKDVSQTALLDAMKERA